MSEPRAGALATFAVFVVVCAACGGGTADTSSGDGSSPSVAGSGTTTVPEPEVVAGSGTTTVPEPPADPPRPATVTVTPSTAQIAALGATVQLSTEVLDQNGRVMVGAAVAWSSSATAVATVGGSGLVTAAANGTATITAAAGAVSESATVSVDQMVSSVTVSPATAELSSLGATVQLTAEAFDENGNLVERAEFSWQSSDVAVATVDTGGLVTAAGSGMATITAMAGATSGAATVTVAGFTLSGTVSDGRMEGLGVPGAIVRLGDGTRGYVLTGADGQYRFSNILGQVEVTVRAVPGYLVQTVQLTVDSGDRTLDFVLEHTGVPPYSGTVWITPDILGPSDPTSLGSVTYTGRGMREVFDRRVDMWVTVDADLFEAQFGERTLEFQVNPEFGSEEAARRQVDTFAPAIGRLPAVLMSKLREVEMNAGEGLFGGNSYNASILIHTDDEATQHALREGYLEEIFLHEAAHAALDPSISDAPGWRSAQRADGAFISEYARDHPDREDVAESFLPYFALRHRPDRLTAEERWIIMMTIPNRLAYFDEQPFDMSTEPVGARNPAVAGQAAFRYSLTSPPQRVARTTRSWRPSGFGGCVGVGCGCRKLGRGP